MIAKIKFKLINHLLGQNDWMQTKLKPYSGKLISLEIDSLIIKLVVNDQGQLILSEANGSPDASIQMSLTSFIQLVTQKKKMGITVKGNLDFAHDFSIVIQSLQWDIEDDLSRFIGDIPATELTKIGKVFLKHSKNNIRNLAENFIEFWQEENKILSKTNDLNDFYRQVDKLTEDVDRVEAKINSLMGEVSK